MYDYFDVLFATKQINQYPSNYFIAMPTKVNFASVEYSDNDKQWLSDEKKILAWYTLICNILKHYLRRKNQRSAKKVQQQILCNFKI